MSENYKPSCENCGTTNKIVHSGVDAFLLGVDTGNICYDCAAWKQTAHK